MDLFTAEGTERSAASAPLADRMRPATFDEVVGQQHLVGPKGRLRKQLEAGYVPNMLLTGPPGTGKTTIARLIADAGGLHLEELSAVACGLADVRRVVADATKRLGAVGTGTLLFLDEIHRFNRAQQDALLPAVEDGRVRLVGATTENPYATINKALRSRSVTFQLEPVSDEDLAELFDRVFVEERGLAGKRPGGPAGLSAEASAELIGLAGGDVRTALTILEGAFWHAGGDAIEVEDVAAASQQRRVHHDRAGDQHYDVISAYIKSMRAGDVEGSLSYLAAMLVGGEDPVFVARRLVIFASEDIGPAKPLALVLASAALQTTERIGMPECRIALSQVTRYCAECPKSRQAYEDIDRHMEQVRHMGTPDIPDEFDEQEEVQVSGRGMVRLGILDHQLSTKLRAPKATAWVSVVHRASQTGSYGVIWVLLFAVVASWLAGWKPAAVASACVLGSLMFNTLIKGRIKRPRPAENPIGHQPTTHSMPSAHTVMAVVGATCMTMVAPEAAPLWWGWMLILAWSRVYLGMHYLGDVLAGVLLGAAISILIAYPAMSWAL